MYKNQIERRLNVLEKEIRRLKANLPVHSVPPSMLIRLEELEDEYQALLGQKTPLRGGRFVV